MSKRITKKISIDRVDEDGVLHHESGYEKMNVEVEPAFAKMYFGDVGRMFGLSPLTRDIMISLVTKMGYGNGEVYVSSGLKREICNRLCVFSQNGEVSLPTFNNCLYKLIAKGLLIKKDRGVYLVNPYVFGRGEWKDIKEIRSTVVYGENKTSISTEKQNK